MIIALVHSNKAILPEIEMYCRFFAQHTITCEIVDKDEVGLMHRHVEWRIMGTDLSKPKEGIIKIHEYCSASTPPRRRWKNWSKSFFNTQPDFRLFQNAYVKKAFSFHDTIPYGYRDMGIPAEWLQPPQQPEKEYDFIYTGDCSPFREMERLLNCFATGNMQQHTLQIVGKHYEYLKQVYSNSPNIFFTGPIPYEQIPVYLQKARYGINFIADKEPLNRQTSTKLLDYAACGLPVISTHYSWMEQFQQQNGGNYFYLSPDLSNFTWENISSFPYEAPDMQNWTWEKQIRNSGVLEFLEAKFPEIKF